MHTIAKPTFLKKLLFKFLILAVTGFFTLLFMGRYQFKSIYLAEKALHLQNIALVQRDSVRALLLVNDQVGLQKLISKNGKESQQRITVILKNGEVIADTKKDPSLLLNHGDRPEVIAALKGGVGQSIRYSDSLNEESIYVAVPVNGEDGQLLAVLRHSYITHDLKPVLWSYTWRFFWGTLVIGVLFILLLSITTRDLGKSLNRIHEKARNFAKGDFADPIPSYPDEPFEISSLVKSLNEMAQKLGGLFGKIERQKNEREAIFSGMSEGVLSVYMDDNIFHLNQSVCEIFGVPYSKEYKGTPLLKVFRNTEINNFLTLVKNQKSFVEDEIRLSNGKVLQLHGSLLKQDSGEELGVLIVFNDITHLRKLENHRKEFVANVSHELRTPLTSIQGYVETLLDGSVDEEELRQKFLQTIKRNSERLSHIIEDLLVLSELDKEDGKDTVQLEVQHISSVLKNVVASSAARALKKEIKIQLEIEEDILITVNSRLLEQAIENLIDNAIKYGHPKSNIFVKCNKDVESEEINIYVIDEGPGIAEEHIERLFERFYSVDKARSRELGGSGLGLSIVKNIAHVHGGSVSVESQVGVGSKFKLTLPFKPLGNC